MIFTASLLFKSHVDDIEGMHNSPPRTLQRKQAGTSMRVFVLWQGKFKEYCAETFSNTFKINPREQEYKRTDQVNHLNKYQN